MRSYLPAYEMQAPRTLDAALVLLAREPGAWKPLAGGTDLMVLLEAGKLSHKRFLSLWHLKELQGIVETPEFITLGGLTTYTQVQASATLRREFPLLCRAASETGGIATQNRGTLAGNIVNGSPGADSPPALLVYDAELELVSACGEPAVAGRTAHGSRWVPYHGFHTGYKQMLLRPEELIRRIRLPRNKKNWKHYYRKVGTRKAQAISKVCFAGAARIEKDTVQEIRIALGSVSPTPLRSVETEKVLRGRRLSDETIRAAQDAMAREIKPIDDFRSTAAYRSRVARNLLQEFLSQLNETKFR